MAEAENIAVFHGWSAAGIKGIAEAATAEAISLGTNVAEYPSPVARAVELLLSAGIVGPYGLALGPDGYTDMVETTEHGGLIVFDHLRQILGGPIVWAPGVVGAVVVSLRGGDFLFESGEDISVGYDSHDANQVNFYLEESFSFRVVTPEAAVVLIPDGRAFRRARWLLALCRSFTCAAPSPLPRLPPAAPCPRPLPAPGRSLPPLLASPPKTVSKTGPGLVLLTVFDVGHTQIFRKRLVKPASHPPHRFTNRFRDSSRSFRSKTVNKNLSAPFIDRFARLPVRRIGSPVDRPQGRSVRESVKLLDDLVAEPSVVGHVVELLGFQVAVQPFLVGLLQPRFLQAGPDPDPLTDGSTTRRNRYHSGSLGWARSVVGDVPRRPFRRVAGRKAMARRAPKNCRL